MPSHYQNQCWNIVNWTLRNKLQWKFYWNSYIFIQENALENVAWKMAAILSRPQCVNCIMYQPDPRIKDQLKVICKVYNLVPTAAKFCVMWEGLSLRSIIFQNLGQLFSFTEVFHFFLFCRWHSCLEVVLHVKFQNDWVTPESTVNVPRFPEIWV